jgi:predicted nuclease of predicted toxin-antitoxin system
VTKLLIDECLHTSLLELAHAAGHIADHVTYLGLGNSKDRELVKLSVERDYTFVTNNRSDFLAPTRGRIQPIPGGVTCTSNERTNTEWQDMPDLTYTKDE